MLGRQGAFVINCNVNVLVIFEEEACNLASSINCVISSRQSLIYILIFASVKETLGRAVAPLTSLLPILVDGSDGLFLWIPHYFALRYGDGEIHCRLIP